MMTSKSLAFFALVVPSIFVVPQLLSAQDPFSDPFGGATTAAPSAAIGGAPAADVAKPAEDDDPLIKSIVNADRKRPRLDSRYPLTP